MWDVDNRTPFAAERGWVRDRNGAEVWLVAVKCTFDIGPDGSTHVSEKQPPVLRVPEYFGEPGKSSIKYENDLVLTKQTTDIVVVGHAYAPEGQPITEMEVGFTLGPVQKILRVTGDREWGAGGRSGAVPFVKMPLTYERAFGGVDRRSANPEREFDWRNPIGTGYAVSRDNISGVALPNIEYPGEAVSSWKDKPRPAGFGPMAGDWQPRVGFAGTYDDRWMKTRQPLLPDDFDERYFQCVPHDQQTPSFLRGGEPVVLHHLTPRGQLRFVLPKVFLGFDTRFYDGSRELHTQRRLNTVIVEPDFPRVSLVWHTALPCHFKVQKLQRTIVALKTMVGDAQSSDESAEFETS